MLKLIWDLFDKSVSEAAYVPNPQIAYPKAYPPYNPFMDLHIVQTREKMKSGVVITGTPGIGENSASFFMRLTHRFFRENPVSSIRARTASARATDNRPAVL